MADTIAVQTTGSHKYMPCKPRRNVSFVWKYMVLEEINDIWCLPDGSVWGWVSDPPLPSFRYPARRSPNMSYAVLQMQLRCWKYMLNFQYSFFYVHILFILAINTWRYLHGRLYTYKTIACRGVLIPAPAFFDSEMFFSLQLSSQMAAPSLYAVRAVYSGGGSTPVSQ